MKKPSLALIIAGRMKKAPDSEPDMEDESMESESEGMEKSAMSDFIDAVHAKDVDGAHAALRDFIEMVEHSESKSEEE